MKDDVELRIPTKPRDAEVRRPDFRYRKRMDYGDFANPKFNKLIQLPLKPYTTD